MNYNCSFAAPRSDRLIFPTLPALPYACGPVEKRISHVGNLLRSPLSIFGLDQAVQYLLEDDGEGANDLRPRKVYYRTPQEPVLLSEWTKLRTLDFGPLGPGATVSLMLGAPAEHRTDEIWVHDDNGRRYYFEEIPQAVTWMADIRGIRSRGYSPFVEAALSYAKVVLAHPFRDGNGRFARAIFYGALAHRGLISTPCLALGAIFDHFRSDLAHATRNLAYHEDWSSYFGALDEMISWGCVKIEAAAAARTIDLGEKIKCDR